MKNSETDNIECNIVVKVYDDYEKKKKYIECFYKLKIVMF